MVKLRVYPHMSVAQNIGYSLKVLVFRSPRTQRIQAVARTLELEHRSPQADGLPADQRQRVAKGRAMIREQRCSCSTNRCQS